MELTLTTEQRVLVHCTPVTATGKPAKLDGAVEFTCPDDPSRVETVDANSAYLSSSDVAGDVTVNVAADADLGPGVETITDVITLHCKDPSASNLGLTADKPVAKP